MAEPRKVPFVTLAAAASSPPEPLRKKKDKQQPAAAAGGTEQAPGSDGKSTGGLQTVRLELSLSEPTQEGCAEFNYPHLVQASRKPPPNPADPFDDEERERLEVEALAKKFEVKYCQVELHTDGEPRLR
nr:PREDICTED: ubinuclein-2-like [Latimeria chalumnae]|eukprot:XP_014347476.1 PREDICTED: ubinuclein-2-like [Latimeria chalumnae]